jgi:hypothetical protein
VGLLRATPIFETRIVKKCTETNGYFLEYSHTNYNLNDLPLKGAIVEQELKG